MIIAFIGPPGSGKGTQAVLMTKTLAMPYLSTGEVLRAKIQSGGKESDDLRELMASGKLVPSHIVNNLIIDALTKNNDCILDGYPRNLDQAEFLEKNYKGEILVIYFDIDESLLFKRLSGRFGCAKCGKIYNKYFSAPKIENVCDDCSSNEFVCRADDAEEAIVTRLKAYYAETKPVVDYYKALGKLKAIDASAEVKKISEELKLLLKK